MSTLSSSAFARLKELARDNSVEERRELLRSITDMFLAQSSSKSESECMLFDEVVGAVVKDMQSSVRAELAGKLAKSDAPVNKTLLSFAMDEDINVARPVLENSTQLTDDDLIKVVTSRTQEHILAITKRKGVSESVSGAIVDRGADHVIASLLDNSTAEIGRDSMEKVANKAINSDLLQKSFVGRDDVPLDLLNELVLVVEKDLREEIMNRFQNVSESELDAALARSRRLVRQNFGRESREQKIAISQIDRISQYEPLTTNHLPRFLKEHDAAAFSEVLNRLSGIGYQNALNIYKGRDVDSLAFVMKALDAPLNVFAVTAAYIVGKFHAVNAVQEFGPLYQEVSHEAASRALRFWKVRNANAEAA
ncbi:MAG: hypothetical protein CMK09_17345 [Ponticaulis sp.]|nr:hypothetical protein [Ponticaulis sp.]|tara:strand:- start:16971 stop:18068 length:1098 start_codon:yes stop_codon:yes gene_type:complete